MLRHLLMTFTLAGSIATPASADCVLQADPSFRIRQDLSQMLFEPQLVAADPTQFSWTYAEAFPGAQIDGADWPELDCAGKGHGQAAAQPKKESRDFQVRFVEMPDFAPVEWKDIPASGASDETPGLAGMVPTDLGPAPVMEKSELNVKSIATGRTLSQQQHTARVKVTIPDPTGAALR